jgi:Alpha galactosidase C-terminal beta sandwich domain
MEKSNVENVGLFKRQRTTEQMSVNFSQVGLRGPATVRDLWLKKEAQDTFRAYVPRHGVVLVKIQGK